MDRVPYQIKDWQENFENERTSKFGCRLHLEIPTTYRSQECKYLLKHKDGGWHFAAWILLLEWHARTTPPREGWITHNGKAGGIPLTPVDLQEELRIPARYIKTALEILSSPPINWIADEGSADTAHTQRKGSAKVESLILLNSTQPYQTISNEFEIFWLAYPKERRVAKKKCLDWWMRNKPDSGLIEKMLKTLPAWIVSDAWANPKFIPHPLTWLNGGRWDDEVPQDETAAQNEAEAIKRHERLKREEAEAAPPEVMHRELQKILNKSPRT